MTLGNLGQNAARLGRTLRSRSGLARDRRRTERRRARGAAELSVVLVAGALTAGVMFGQGLSRTSVDLADGLTWLGDGPSGEIMQVNPATGDLENRRLVGAPGDDVQVAQFGGQLYVTNHTTGQLMAFDLTSLLVAGQRRVSVGGAVQVLMHDDHAFLVDSEQSTIAAIDPVRTDAIGTIWVAPEGLADAAIDDDGTVWALEDDGTLHELVWSDDAQEFDDEQTHEVEMSGPESVLVSHTRGVTVFGADQGIVEQVGTGNDMAADAPKLAGDLRAPERAPADLVPVAASDTGTVVLATTEGVREVDMSSIQCGDPGTPEVFHGLVYVPCRGEGRVVKLDQSGVRDGNDIDTPGSRDPEIVVDDDSLVVNTPGARTGVVVHGDGRITTIVRDDPQVPPVPPSSTSTPPPPPPPDVFDDLFGAGHGDDQGDQGDEGDDGWGWGDQWGDDDDHDQAGGDDHGNPWDDDEGDGNNNDNDDNDQGDNNDDDNGNSHGNDDDGDETDGPGHGDGDGRGGDDGDGRDHGDDNGDDDGDNGDDDGEGPGIDPGQPTTDDRLDAPTSVTARALAEGQVELSWTHSGTPKPAGFTVQSVAGKQYATTKGFTRQVVITVPPGEATAFTVTAVLDEEKATSPPSSTVTSTARPGAPTVTGSAGYTGDGAGLVVDIGWGDAPANGAPVTAYDVTVTTKDGSQTQRLDPLARAARFTYTCDRAADPSCVAGGDFTTSVVATNAHGGGAPGTFAGTAGAPPAPPPVEPPLPARDQAIVNPNSPGQSAATVEGQGEMTLVLSPPADWAQFSGACQVHHENGTAAIPCNAQQVTLSYSNGYMWQPSNGQVGHNVFFTASNGNGTSRSQDYVYYSNQPVLCEGCQIP